MNEEQTFNDAVPYAGQKKYFKTEKGKKALSKAQKNYKSKPEVKLHISEQAKLKYDKQLNKQKIERYYNTPKGKITKEISAIKQKIKCTRNLSQECIDLLQIELKNLLLKRSQL